MSCRIERLMTEARNREHITEERLSELEKTPDSLHIEISSVKSFFLDNIFSFFIVMLSGLISLLYIPSIREVLDLTGNSSTRQVTFNRYMRTVNHTISWYWDESSQIKSLSQVRRAHLMANKSTRERRSHGSFMTQYDMVVTQWAFVGLIYTHSESFGLKNPAPSGLEALRILMHKVGYFLGIEEEFNLCSGSVEATRTYSLEIYEHIIKPALDKGSSESDDMTEILLWGINIINPFVFPLSFGKWCFMALGSKVRAERLQLTFPSVTFFLYWLHSFTVGTLLLSPLFRPLVLPVLNSLMRINIYLCNRLYPSLNKMNARLYS